MLKNIEKKALIALLKIKDIRCSLLAFTDYLNYITVLIILL